MPEAYSQVTPGTAAQHFKHRASPLAVDFGRDCGTLLIVPLWPVVGAHELGLPDQRWLQVTRYHHGEIEYACNIRLNGLMDEYLPDPMQAWLRTTCAELLQVL